MEISKCRQGRVPTTPQLKDRPKLPRPLSTPEEGGGGRSSPLSYFSANSEKKRRVVCGVARPVGASPRVATAGPANDWAQTGSPGARRANARRNLIFIPPSHSWQGCAADRHRS